MNEITKTHVNIPKEALDEYLEEIKDYHNCKNYSYGKLLELLAGLYASELKELTKKRKEKGYNFDFFEKVILPNKKDRDATKDVSISIPMVEKEYLKNLTGANNFSDIVTTALCMLIYHYKKQISNNVITNDETSEPLTAKEFVEEQMKRGRYKEFNKEIRPPFHLHGNKYWDGAILYNCMRQLPDSFNKCVDLFGGTGYLTILADLSEHFEECFYNEDDLEKQQFFKTLIKYPVPLKCACLSTQPAPKKVAEATSFWKENSPKNISDKKSTVEYFPDIANIFKEVHLSNKDALKYLKKWLNEENVFIAIDSPYLYSKGYEDRETKTKEKDFPIAKQKTLSEMCSKLKGIFLYFCRITGTRSYNKNDKQEYAEDDAYIKGTIDDLFAGKNYYYLDIKYSGSGTIERMISNYPFDGFEMYK